MSNKLQLKDVLALGGNKEDFEMLKDTRTFAKSTKLKDGHIDKSEVQEIVGKLGLANLSLPQTQKLVKKGASKNPTSNKLHKNSKDTSLKIKQQFKSTKPSWVASKDQYPKTLKYVDKKMTQHSTIYKSMPERLLIKTYGLWFENFCEDPKALISGDQPYLKHLKEYAMALLDNELHLYKEKQRKGFGVSDNEDWMNTVAFAGTLSDRVASLSLMLHDAPLHNLHSFENLLVMSKKKGMREAIMAVDAIKDLLLGDLIPNTRKLRTFLQHPLDTIHTSLTCNDGSGVWTVQSCQSRLILWAFEHRLKEMITVYVDVLKALARDTMDVSKHKAMSIALELLSSKPEQEEALLSMLVNKLGDPKYKIAARALNMLNRVVIQHPMMQAVVVKEVRDLLLVPKLPSRAQYYCVCFLSSQILSHDRKDVAQHLIRIYMNFFKSCVKRKSDDNKMLSALLTGVNRAFPFADLTDETIVGELDILFRAIHVSRLSTTIQSLVLIFQVYNSRNECSDRFYNALYASLFHPELPISSHRHPMFLNLLYRALKADPCEPRIEAMVKRTLQVCSLQRPAFCAATLTMMSELTRARPSLECKFIDWNESAKKNDKSKGEIVKKIDMSKWNDDQEEHFYDIKDGSDVEENTQNEASENRETWVHKHKQSTKFKSDCYQPLHRNPQYCGIESTSLWELHSFTRHFHPTVGLYARNLIEMGGAANQYPGDPLEDFTLIKFLDRFVYKNPKTNPEKTSKGSTHATLSIHRRKRHTSYVDALPVNSQEFLQKEKFNPEDVFFQRYFSSKPHRKQKERKWEIENFSDDEFDKYVNSEEGQKEINRELKSSGNVREKTSLKMTKENINNFSDESDDESDDDFDENDVGEDKYGFEMEEGEEDLLDDAGVFVSDEDLARKRKAKNKPAVNTKRQKQAADAFGMMLEENVSEFDTTSSQALSNKDKSSQKQLRWESKQLQKDAIRKKKEWRKRENGKKKSNFRKGFRNKSSFKK